MKLDDLIVPTAVATPGMLVADLFRECAAKQVPGIPFRNAAGRIVGKASVRHVLKLHCVPDYLVKNVGVLGNTLAGLTLIEDKARAMLATPVDAFVLPDMAIVGRDAPVAKAAAVALIHVGRADLARSWSRRRGKTALWADVACRSVKGYKPLVNPMKRSLIKHGYKISGCCTVRSWIPNH